MEATKDGHVEIMVKLKELEIKGVANQQSLESAILRIEEHLERVENKLDGKMDKLEERVDKLEAALTRFRVIGGTLLGISTFLWTLFSKSFHEFIARIF